MSVHTLTEPAQTRYVTKRRYFLEFSERINMRLCKNCQKKIPESKRSTAEYCSGACKTEYFRNKNGIAPPAFLDFSKPMEITNPQRNSLTVAQANEHKILQAEIGNLQTLFNDALTKYTQYDRVLLEYEATGQLPQQYCVFIQKVKKPKTLFTYPPHKPSLIYNPLPDMERAVKWEYGYRKNEKGVSTYQKWINEEKTKEEKEKLRAKYEKNEAENLEILKVYNEKLRVYEAEQAAVREYEENQRLVKSDKGYSLGVKQLQEKREQLKIQLEHYTSEIAWKKEIIQDNYSEIIEKEAEGKVEFTPIRKLSGKDIANMTFKSYKFIPEWKELLGEPSKPFVGMIYGDAKAGKSYFAMRLAQYLTMFGDVAYFAVEEGLSATTQQKIKATEADDIFLEQAEKIEDVIEALQSGSYAFAFIDSVSALNMSAEDFKVLTDKFPKVSFLVILHTTKSNDFAGEKRWKHDVQMILQVTKLGLRTTKIECTGRFGVGEKTIEY